MSDEVPPSAPGEFQIGSQVAGYRLVEQIGRGGMAVVYRVHDARLDRHVALKIMAPGLAQDDAFRQRFIRESRAAAAVDHPNIIPVFEAGEASGVLFIAMRFVQGRDVRSLLDSTGPLPPARATEIISQVASALDAAHAHGLVHRDVKPANMLLDESVGGDRHEHVYLSDFGLSKQSLSQTGLTSQGQFLGTLDYVAPEQIEGRPIDGRTDLYALACAAFEMMSGAPPFRRDGGLAVIYAQLSTPPPPLTSRRAGLPPAIDQVVAKGMAKAPDNRYRTCGEFAAALRGTFGLGPVEPEDRPRPPREATQLAVPSQPPVPPAPAEPSGPVRAGDTAAAQGQRPDSDAGPATQAARMPPRPTRPGLTEPGPSGQTGQGVYGEPVRGGGPRRPWYRSRGALAAAAAVVVLAVIGGFVLLRSGGGSSGGGGGGGGGGAPVANVQPPVCSTASASAKPLTKVRSHSVTLGGTPFGVAVTQDGKFSFVPTGDHVVVLSNNHGSLAPTQVTSIFAAGAKKSVAITHSGKYVLAAANSGAYVIDAKQAESGGSGILGTLTSPGGKGAVEVSISPDDRFAFVALQYSAEMAVFNLQVSLAHGFGQSGFVGMVPFGEGAQPVGIAQSTDHKWLYVAIQNPAGKLDVLSMKRAEATPKNAVQTTAAAGCGPARVVVSADGKDVWVTDRDSNALVAFSADKLLSKPSQSLIARVNLGQTPIGLTFVKGGKEIMIADSNINGVKGADNLALVNTQQALQGDHGALIGFIPTGKIPREFGMEPDGKTLLVSNNGSGQLQAIDVGSLP
ncbi:MAG TPA: serine/threonine-protein kinase [Streptosporangiaceae bacterium]